MYLWKGAVRSHENWAVRSHASPAVRSIVTQSSFHMIKRRKEKHQVGFSLFKSYPSVTQDSYQWLENQFLQLLKPVYPAQVNKRLHSTLKFQMLLPTQRKKTCWINSSAREVKQHLANEQTNKHGREGTPSPPASLKLILAELRSFSKPWFFIWKIEKALYHKVALRITQDNICEDT